MNLRNADRRRAALPPVIHCSILAEDANGRRQCGIQTNTLLKAERKPFSELRGRFGDPRSLISIRLRQTAPASCLVLDSKMDLHLTQAAANHRICKYIAKRGKAASVSAWLHQLLQPCLQAQIIRR